MPPPKTELCGISTNLDDLICNDTRLPLGAQDYRRSMKVGDLCTNADDFEALKKNNIAIRQKLYECMKSK